MIQKSTLVALLLISLVSTVRAVFSPKDFSSTLIPVPELQRAPQIDDLNNLENWRGCVKVFGFKNLKSGTPAHYDTHVWLGQYKDAFYLRFRCFTKRGMRPLTNIRFRDGKIWKEDSVEIYLAPENAVNECDYYQFGVSAINSQMDLFKQQFKWNGKWQSRTKILSDGWIAAVKIPWSTIGCGSRPARLRFNLARTIIGAPQPESTVLVWLNRKNYYTNAKEGGVLSFTPGTPAAAVEKTGNFAAGSIKLKVDAVCLPESGFVDAFLGLYDFSGKLVAKASRQPRFDSRNGILSLPEVNDGLYVLRFILAPAEKGVIPAYYGGGATKNKVNLKSAFMRLDWPVIVNNKVRLDSTLKLSDQGKRMHCQIRLIGQLPGMVGKHVQCRFSLLDQRGKKLAVLGNVPFTKRKSELNCKLPDLPERSKFRVLSELFSANKILFSEEIKFATPPKPGWVGNKEGVFPGKVPAPWTPVEFQGRTVSLWGREYVFSNSPVPSKITSQGVSLLQSPCRLVCDPQITNWKLISAQKESPAAVVFKWRGTSDHGLVLQATTRVEFDGVVRVDVSVPAGARMKTLYLDIPYRRDLASFVHRGPVQFGGMFTTYPLPDTSRNHPIRNNFFLLNDHVGLCWFDGMKFDWNLKNPAAAIQLLRSKSKVNLRVNYIDSPKVYPMTRTYTFGLEAIPARPLPQREPGLRTCYVYRYGDENSKRSPAWFSTVDYIADGNIKMDRGTVEIWCKPDFDPRTHKQNEVFFETSHGQDWKMLLEWRPHGGIVAVIDEKGRKKTLAGDIPLKKDTWTHVALTWGKRLALYVDGKRVKTLPHKGALKVFPVNIFAGGNKVFVDGLKISDNVRTSFELAGPPRVDQHTLLLDNFEKSSWVNGRRATVPEKISAEAETGYLSPAASIAAGKWGMGVNSMQVPVKSMVEGMAALGMKHIMFHARQYTDEACAGLYIKDKKAFKKALKAIHQSGMRAVMYVNNSLSNWDRLWDTYADDWLITPKGTPFIKAGLPNEKTYQACPRSEYIEYYFWRLGKLMDEYKVDGFFLDGRMYSTCGNSRHGCGVKNFEGEKVPGRDVWDGRKNQLRMYNLIKRRNGYCEQHKSGNWDAPTCFLWDCVWEGEQLMRMKLNGRKRLEVMPLYAMRAQMNGLPYGMPCRYAAYAYSPYTPIENCTYAFVHGTTWGMTYRIDEALTLSPYWKALDDFGATYQGFRPYWGKDKPAVSTPDKLVKVSAYVKPGQALLIIANFNEDKPFVKGDIKLNLQALGLQRPVAEDAFSGKPVSLINGDTLPVNIKSFRQAWFLLKDKKPK